jgi:NDP-sugar pyrophosphorylase family protein
MKQAVILCGGKGSRLSPLTDEIPKVLVRINGFSLLEHKLKILKGLVDEVILVLGHKGEMIREKFGNNYGGIRILYCFQEELLGSGHAVMQAKDLLNDNFIVLNGDDFYSREDIESLLSERFGILGFRVEDPSFFGVLDVVDGNLVSIEEKPEKPKSDLVNIGAYAFDVSIFEKKLEKSGRGEYEIVDYLNYLVDKGEDVRVLSTSFWVPVNDFDQLELARLRLKSVNC